MSEDLYNPLAMREPRTAADEDLVPKFEAALIQSGWAGASSWAQEPDIVEAKTKNPVAQRWILTRNLHARFLDRLKDTVFERRLLNNPALTNDELVENVGKFIGPALVKLGI